ncbi:hypothetical protein LI169_18555, partial [Desulfovibrio desulfuricans]|nr:hypothetical protein [Desulfovibrio desulfuricans]
FYKLYLSRIKFQRYILEAVHRDIMGKRVFCGKNLLDATQGERQLAYHVLCMYMQLYTVMHIGIANHQQCFVTAYVGEADTIIPW